jgi:two-component system cell cycle response regulator DivK
MLKHAGYEIVEAPTGEIGLSLAETYQPDVVVLDIGLPGINGWEVCQRLKSTPATAGVKIVIVTAHAFIDESRRAEECGAEALLTKPASPLLIRSYVARLIGPSSLN